MPDFDPARAPRLDPAAWTPERLDTVVSRYAMEYIRTMLPVLLDLLGPGDTRRLLGHAARLIGMQYYHETARLLGITGSSPPDFARYLAALARAQGEDVEVDDAGGHARVRQNGWRLVRDLPPLEPAPLRGLVRAVAGRAGRPRPPPRARGHGRARRGERRHRVRHLVTSCRFGIEKTKGG
jgi:hypothetical protein